MRCERPAPLGLSNQLALKIFFLRFGFEVCSGRGVNVALVGQTGDDLFEAQRNLSGSHVERSGSHASQIDFRFLSPHLSGLALADFAPSAWFS